ncbi:N-acetyltransferase [Bacteroidia bacterium]|nr:N-acetyltransferase [Bacteroidia bacterium]
MKLLENDTLLLRALEPEDLDTLYRWENDTELWCVGSTLTPYSKFTLREYLAKQQQHDIFQTNQLRLMIIEKQSATPVGTIDLFDFDPLNGRAGIGILVDKPFRGRGLAMQSLQLMGDYAFEILHLQQIYAHVPLTNQPSLRLLQKAGYEQSGVLKNWLKTPSGYADVAVMQRLIAPPPAFA